MWTQIFPTSPTNGRFDGGSITYNDQLFIFGGFEWFINYTDEMYVLDMSSPTNWVVAPQSGDVPGRRAAFVWVRYGNLGIFFGGSSNGSNAFNDLRTYNLDTGVWTLISNSFAANPIRPPGNVGARAVVIGDYMYMYGGSTISGVKNDLWELNLIDFTWRSIDNTGPVDTYRGYAFSSDNKAYFFGGFQNINTNNTSDMLLYDPSANLCNRYVIGAAEKDIKQGEKGPIQKTGLTGKWYSGLSAGCQVFINVRGEVFTERNEPLVQVGIAISSSELIIQYAHPL